MRSEIQLKLLLAIRKLLWVDEQLVQEAKILPIGIFEILKYESASSCDNGIFTEVASDITDSILEALQLPVTEEVSNEIWSVLQRQQLSEEYLFNFIKQLKGKYCDLSVRRFIHESIRQLQVKRWEGISTCELYQNYQLFCAEQGYIPISKQRFIKEFVENEASGLGQGFKLTQVKVDDKLIDCIHYDHYYADDSFPDEVGDDL